MTVIALSALIPCATIIITILWLKRSAVWAAALGLIVTIVIWALSVFASPTNTHIQNALVDATILQILVAIVIIPGLIFIVLCERTGATSAVGEILEKLDLNPKMMAIIIAAGFGVLIESLTGFGVSLLITVPLLAKRFERNQTIGLALIGMSLMPWGALGISAHLGSELAQIPLYQLTRMMWLISSPIAMILPVLCLVFVSNTSWRDFKFAVYNGLVLASAIGIGSYWIGVEIAGAAGGIAVIFMVTLKAKGLSGSVYALTTRKLIPYYFLIGSVLIQKALIPLSGLLDNAITLSSDRITFSVITSPGLAILFSIFLTIIFTRYQKKTVRFDLKFVPEIWQRAWQPLATIFLFTLSARLMVEIGATQALAELISITGAYFSLLGVMVLGAISGFATGSGIAGNALFMASAAAAGANFQAIDLFSAIQHVAAGQMAMTALPVGAILIAALPNHRSSDDQTVMRIGLTLNLVYICILGAAGIIILQSIIR